MESKLMIKDLCVAKELGRKELSAVRGGSTFSNSGTNLAAALGGDGIGNTATAVVVAPVNQIDASQHLHQTEQTVNASSVFGDASAWAAKVL